MAENKNEEQRARAFDSLSMRYLEEALKEQAPAPTVEVLAAESMTLHYVQASLNSALVQPAKAQAPGSSEDKSSEK